MLKLLPSFVQNPNLKIETPDGFEKFMGIQKIYRKKYMHLYFENGEELICSCNHPLATIEGKIKAKDLKKTVEILTKTSGTFLLKKKTIRKNIELFDIVNSGKNHQYYANNICSTNCSFLGSSDTLIKTTTLVSLVHATPIESNNYLTIYEKPNPTSRYMITVDTAEGVERDYSTCVVIDITDIPYKVVAIYKNNLIAPMIFPNIIYKLANEYNKAFVFIEMNAMGTQVADILFADLEYDNMLQTAMVGRSGLKLGQGFASKCKNGLQITKSTKRLGCSNLKSLTENDKLVINDFGIISELGTFIASGDSYAADDGSNDDLVACLVVFSWCVTQPYFKELVDLDVSKSINELHRQELEEEMNLFGFLLMNGEDIDNPTEEIDSDGTLWSNTNNQVQDEYWEYGVTTSLWEYF